MQAESFVEKKLNWTVLPGATVLPYRNDGGRLCGGVLDRDGTFLDGSGLNRGQDYGYDLSGKEIEGLEEDVVFLGLWPEVWGHCLTDNLRRLWVLSDETFMSRYGTLRFLYLPMDGREPGKNFRELLEILGAGEIRLEAIDRITRFRNIILPDECFFREADGTRRFTREYRVMIDRIRDYGQAHFQKTEDRKLYFTYRSYGTLRCIGERKLERFFVKHGYRVVSPEKYSFSEQLNMFLNCESFASTIGSVSHNNIFLKDHTEVILISRAGFITEYQPALDQIHDLNVTYVDSTLSVYANPKRPWDGPFYFIVSRNLRECFGEKGRSRISRFDFLLYRTIGFIMNGEQAPDAYYKEVCPQYLKPALMKKRKETLFVRLCRKHKVRRWIERFFG